MEQEVKKLEEDALVLLKALKELEPQLANVLDKVTTDLPEVRRVSGKCITAVTAAEESGREDLALRLLDARAWCLRQTYVPAEVHLAEALHLLSAIRQQLQFALKHE